MATGSSSGGLLHQMRSSGIGHLLAARFLQITSLLICYPYLPTLTTDLFASAAAGHKMDCAGFSPNNTPAVCVDAHASVVSYSAVAGVVSSGVVSVFLTPILGKFSDLHGRKPVILLGFYTTLPSLLALLFATQGYAPVAAFFCVSALLDGVSSMAASQAYVADLISASTRAAAFGLVTAAVSAALLLGPALSGLLSSATLALEVAIVGISLTSLWVSFALPESLSIEARKLEAARRADEESDNTGCCSAAAGAAFGGLKLVFRDSRMRILTALTVASSVAGDALSDVTSQYLALRVRFQPRDFALYYILIGACGITVQAFVMRPLLHHGGERGAALIGWICFLIKLLVLALCPHLTKSGALAAAAIGTGAEMIFPALSASLSNAAGSHEQGAVQGGLFAARSVASGLAPLGWAALFRASTRQHSRIPVQTPFAVAALVVAAATLSTLTLARHAPPIQTGVLSEPLLDEEQGAETVDKDAGDECASEDARGTDADA